MLHWQVELPLLVETQAEPGSLLWTPVEDNRIFIRHLWLEKGKSRLYKSDM